MLMIERKIGERIVIGDDIVLTVAYIAHDPGFARRVGLGIEAPRELSIMREELLRRNEAPRLAAADGCGPRESVRAGS